MAPAILFDTPLIFTFLSLVYKLWAVAFLMAATPAVERAKFLAKGKPYEATYPSSRGDGGARRRQQ
jgi:hypothetical protein